MADLYNPILNTLKKGFEKLTAEKGRVRNFSYTQQVFEDAVNATDETALEDSIFGADSYSFDKEQNIPVDADTDPVILDKGIRGQGASITRNFQNHFLGRLSFNLNFIATKILVILELLDNVFQMNSGLYLPFRKYKAGDICFFIDEFNGQAYMRQFQCLIDCQNVPVANETHWQEIKDAVMLPDFVDILDPNELDYASEYCFTATNTTPNIPTTVTGEVKLVTTPITQTIMLQRLVQLDGIVTFERTVDFSAGICVVLDDWAMMTAVDKEPLLDKFGSYVFRIVDGHLFIYYKKQPAPDVHIERDLTKDDYGHCYIKYVVEP